MSQRKEVLLWSSAGSGDGVSNLKTHPASADGGFTDSVECHGGENSGQAQHRLVARTGKYASLPGLTWMKDLRCDSFHWSGNPNDTNRSNTDTTNGGIIIHDHVRGGPWSRLESIHVIDCEGFDYLTLHWQCKILQYEGLHIDSTLTTTDPTRWDFTDFMRFKAAGMPSIDSSEEMFTLPKLMRMHQDGIGRESTSTYTGVANPQANSRFITASATIATDTFAMASSYAHGLAAGDIINFSSVTTVTNITAGVNYYVRTAGLTASAFTISTTGAGGAIVDLQTANGTVTIGNIVRVATAVNATNIITVANGHGLLTGEPVQFWNDHATGVLPAATSFLKELSMGKTYYAIVLSSTTLQVAHAPGGTAIDISDDGTAPWGILINQKDPGTGPGGLVWRNEFAITDINWQPQRWIHGGEMLWCKGRAAMYPGANHWLQYDEIWPAAGFENSGTENLLSSIQGVTGPMFKQFGRIYRLGDARNLKWCGRGDRFEAKVDLGYPVLSRGASHSAIANDRNAATGDASVNAALAHGVEMRITGLARIALIVGGVCVNFHGEGAVATQAGDGNGNTFLVSNPIAPATAPRQHIRGRLKAVLSTR